ncbi:MAG: NupC/NupG family nucleoside CNT transporter [Thermoanaerobaculia bacterium]|nr:NupC/NupG family nucleoside CNT transporter [Thermoanaerobaculia bacterium]
MDRWIGLIGIVVILGIAYVFSANRRAIRWYTVGWGFALQILFAFLVLYWEAGKNALERFSFAITGAISYADQGGSFIFGWLAGPMDALGQATGLPIHGYIFGFKVLPIIIFIAAFFTIMYYLGIMQKIVQGMAWVMRRLMKVSGAESLAVAANVFIGQTEAPILIAPYIPTMTRSEILTMMTGGMAHVSGAVLLAYVAMGIPAEYLITASVMAAPGAIMMAKILLPETETPVTMGEVKLKVEKTHTNVIDAAASGAGQGMTLVINIVAMLIAFIALIALLNGFLGWVGGLFGYPNFQLQTVFGWVLWPLAVVMGVPVKDAATVADLIGNKTVINEFFAYAKMSTVQAGMSEKARIIASFALCGFANFSSIGIQIGGIGGLAPTRKSDIAQLGFRALLGGSLASFMTATIAGLLAG